MNSDTQAIVQEVLLWPPTERASLIEVLLSSFDAASRRAVDAAWARESESRIDAYEAGELQAVTLEEALARINAR